MTHRLLVPESLTLGDVTLYVFWGDFRSKCIQLTPRGSGNHTLKRLNCMGIIPQSDWDWLNQEYYTPERLKRSFQKNATFLRSFAFFSKERNVLKFFCVLYKKNAAYFAFFYVIYKRTLRSLRCFTFFIEECGVLWVLLRSL